MQADRKRRALTAAQHRALGPLMGGLCRAEACFVLQAAVPAGGARAGVGVARRLLAGPRRAVQTGGRDCWRRLGVASGPDGLPMLGPPVHSSHAAGGAQARPPRLPLSFQVGGAFSIVDQDGARPGSRVECVRHGCHSAPGCCLPMPGPPARPAGPQQRLWATARPLAAPCEPGIPPARRSARAAALAGQRGQALSGRAPPAGCSAAPPLPPCPDAAAASPLRPLLPRPPAAVLKKRKRDEDWAAKKVGAACRALQTSQLASGALHCCRPARPPPRGMLCSTACLPLLLCPRRRPLRQLRLSRRARRSARRSSSGRRLT